MLIAFAAYLEQCQKRGRRLTFEVGAGGGAGEGWAGQGVGRSCIVSSSPGLQTASVPSAQLCIVSG